MTHQSDLRRVLAVALRASREESYTAIQPLLEYDRVQGGDLVKTLLVYFALQGNASRAAEALYLHRSGLLYRLRRIEDLLGLRLDSFRDRVALEIALLALEADSEPGMEV